MPLKPALPEPVYTKRNATLYRGDCLDALKSMPDASVDSIVTDPPYGLSTPPDPLAMLHGWLEHGYYAVKAKKGFMGKTWDAFVPQPVVWRECFRVLKPGGHLLAFAGTRTHDLMGLSIRLAGFEIRDTIMWVYGSGFPKSHNLKDDWSGWGTALKPALEPITVARKPLEGTVADNVLRYGTGGINVDGCRVPPSDKLGGGAEKETTPEQKGDEGWTRPWVRDADARSAHAERVQANVRRAEALGRWPANLIHDGSDEVVAGFPDSNGSGKSRKLNRGSRKKKGWGMSDAPGKLRDAGAGSAARFFYAAKASKHDRDEGLDDLPTVTADPYGQHRGRRMKGNDTRIDGKPPAQGKNDHPTVKPTDLMRYLVRLVTPPGGVVLDPYTGSGSTGKAAILEGFKFVGIEREADYCKIAKRRLRHARKAVKTAKIQRDG
jgi:site-specific DNA-methyltransferase (adenine-specific)